jgi:hypothetical protein
VGRIGSGRGRRVLLCCRAGPRGQGRCPSGARCTSWCCVSCSGSTRQGRSRAGEGAPIEPRGQKKCGSDCRTKLAAEAAANTDVEAARRELLLAEKMAATDSPLQAPTWLLPAALDLVAFMAIWTALSGYGSRQAREAQTKRSGCEGTSRSSVPAHSQRQHQCRSFQHGLGETLGVP